MDVLSPPEPCVQIEASLDVVVCQEMAILVAKIIVDVIKIWSVLTGYRVILVRTRQCQLVEDGLISAHETVVLHANFVVRCGHRVTDVEELQGSTVNLCCYSSIVDETAQQMGKEKKIDSQYL